MPVQVVLDHPRSHLLARLWRKITRAGGAIMLVAGIVASLVAVPATLLAIGWLLEADIAIPLESGFVIGADEILFAWLVSTPLAIAGLRHGLRLVRQARALVIFLRRFGDDEAMNAVTFAVSRTLGGAWRIVTLDDAEIEPLGVPAPTRLLFRTAGALTAGAGTVLLAAGRVVPFVPAVLLAIVASDLVLARIWERPMDGNAWSAVLTPFIDVVSTVLSGRMPVERIGFHPPGVFAAIVIAVGWTVHSLVDVVTAAPVALAAAVVVLLVVGAPARAVIAAENAKLRHIMAPGHITEAVKALAAGRSDIFGPRLVVLRVATPIWREAVRRFAAEASVALVDVSEPSEHLVWEVAELMGKPAIRCVFIGHHEDVLRLAAPAVADEAGRWHRELAALLEWEEILAYTTDGAGMRRFARALRNRLMSPPAADQAQARRSVYGQA